MLIKNIVQSERKDKPQAGRKHQQQYTQKRINNIQNIKTLTCKDNTIENIEGKNEWPITIRKYLQSQKLSEENKLKSHKVPFYIHEIGKRMEMSGVGKDVEQHTLLVGV